MAYTDRVILGIIFILINSILFSLAILQIYRSVGLFNNVSVYKNKLRIRLLNLWGTLLLVVFALIDADFWIYDRDQPPTISDGVYYLNIVIKAMCDITICVTGSIIVLSLIRSYFVTNLGDPEFPGYITTFWLCIASSFSLIVFVCVVVAVAAQKWIAVHIYRFCIHSIYPLSASTECTQNMYTLCIHYQSVLYIHCSNAFKFIVIHC